MGKTMRRVKKIDNRDADFYVAWNVKHGKDPMEYFRDSHNRGINGIHRSIKASERVLSRANKRNIIRNIKRSIDFDDIEAVDNVNYHHKHRSKVAWIW